MKFPTSVAALALASWLTSSAAWSATLVPTGSTWGWRPGNGEASFPVGAWRLAGFDDRPFTQAPAPFWYGDVLEGGTRIDGMQNVYGCIFLRSPFVVTNLAEIGGLRMRAQVDDGLVAWINGVEVLRIGVAGTPGSEVTYSTLASNAAEPVSFGTYALPAPSTYLNAGTNLLAVQVFQSSVASSDLGFEAALESVLVDGVPPVIREVQPAPSSTVTRLTEITVAFSEPVAGVVAAHLLVGGIGAADVVRVDAATYTFKFAQPAYGEVAVRWSPLQTVVDEATPPNPFDATAPAAMWGYRLEDRTPPSVMGMVPARGATVRSLDSITVVFSEPVAGLDAADLEIGGRAATNVTALAATEYRFQFPPPPTGSVQVAWSDRHGIVDRAPEPNAFAGGSWTLRLDPNAPEHLPYLSEFMASNTRTYRDETGQYTDWIEIHNPSAAPLDLEGWWLTDSTNSLTKWRFPATNVAAHGFLVVHASGQNRRVPGQRLHTSFQLGADGEYLALVRPDGVTVASEYAPAYPRQVPDVSHGIVQVPEGPGWGMGPAGVYFVKPTPGEPNLGGTSVPGPRVLEVQHTPSVPGVGEALVVTARVEPSFQPVASATLRYRILFGPELSTPMFDDGLHGDGAAFDGVFGASIPGLAAAAGQMIRYAVAATDTAGASSRWPLVAPNQGGVEEYLGTIVQPGSIETRLPVIHLFVAPGQAGAIDSEGGGRVSVFHDGEFYDNVSMEVRGNTSAGLNKKSHRLEFNRGREFRHPGPGGRVRKTSLLAEYLDPSYLRQHLCFWLLDRIGVPSPFNYPVRVHMNGQFYQLAFHSDVLGQEQMERMGYDPRGALYKAVGLVTPDFYSTGVFQKLEPDGDPTRTDYLQLANGIHDSATLEARRRAVFDLLDVPQVINHLAGTRWCAENDDVWANMSLYRDTWGDGLWRCIPFDMNASWGQLYGGSSPLEATVDGSKSHPLYGGSSTEGNFNRLYDVIVRLPETRQMLLRRERSVLDLVVQPPGTPPDARIIEGYIRQMTNLIAAEAALDRARWGSSPWAPGKSFAAGVGDLLTQFVEPRRRHWYVTHSITNTSRPLGIGPGNNAGIPLAQPTNAVLTFVGAEFNPASGNQAQEFVALSNAQPYAVDLSGWKLTGAVNFTFRPGTVVPSNAVVHVSPDVRQFRARTSSPRGGEGRFVVGPYSGQLSARGETLTLRNDRGDAVATWAYPGNPSPAQQFLRIAELQFHPAVETGSPWSPDEFEFVELVNLSTRTALDLAGVRFVNGVEFDFSTAAVRRLEPGERVLVVANAVAFAARHGTGLPVAGEYLGRLDNGGERLRLVDASNEEILDFSYHDDWYPAADGGGFALVIADPAAAPDAWGDALQWRPGRIPGGTPGRDETGPLPGAPILITPPLSQGVVPGAPLILSLAVTNTALLPLGIEVRRGTGTTEPTPVAFHTVQSHMFFLTLSGAETSPPWTRYVFRITNAAAPAGILSDEVRITHEPDTDGNGLPDAWERGVWGRLGADPADDPDVDGLDNRAEYMAGTDPARASSSLRIEWAKAPPAAVLSFLAVSNRTYSVQFTDTLGQGTWQRLAEVPARPENRVVEVPDPEVRPGRTYRVATPRQP